jgi:hypothetical protein
VEDFLTVKKLSETLPSYGDTQLDFNSEDTRQIRSPKLAAFHEQHSGRGSLGKKDPPSLAGDSETVE